jgi:hypothetical protein
MLTDEWLCDVATDYPGKCVIIACALTIIERAILPERPVFFRSCRPAWRGQDSQFETLLLRSSKSEMMALSSPGKMNVG